MGIQYRSIILFMTLPILFVSCHNNRQETEFEMPALYAPPLTIQLNTEAGYIINPVTGDSIQPLINSMGDTIKTGVPIPVKGKIINPGSVGNPVIVTAGNPQAVPLKSNVHRIPENITIIPVDKAKLRTFTPGVDTPAYVLVDPSGDTIPTGIPFPVKGRVVHCVQPKPVVALPPSISMDTRFSRKILNEHHGLIDSYVLAMMEDRQGNIWFNTADKGVCRYNGKTFTHYTEKEGFFNNYVSSILEDNQGNLWFGTYGPSGGGLCMYNGQTCTHFSHDEGLINTNILCMILDSHENIWFGTEGGGAAMYDGKTMMHFTTKEGLQDNNVLAIMEDKQGNIWFGTRGGASKFDGEIFTHFDSRDGLRNAITSILEDKQGNIWFGTDIGAYKYNGESFIHFTRKEGFNNLRVNTIFEDSHGDLWFCTEGASVDRYNGESLTHFSIYDGNVRCILEDSQGNMWFGSGGVNICSNLYFNYLSFNEGLSYNYIASISEDSQGNLWFGTGLGLNKYNGDSISNFYTRHGLSDDWIYSILVDSKGNLWLGTRNAGVNKYDGKTFTQFTEKEGLSNNRVYSIVEDKNGNLWFGTEGGGVSMYNGETFTHYTEKEGLSNNDIRSIAEDSQGNLWFGTYGSGVCKYDGETIIHITEKEGLGSNFVHCIFEDSYGNLWFGTEGGGASIFNGETFMLITEKEGLSDNCAWSIMEDNNRNIWVGTRNGLNFLDVGSGNVFRTAWDSYNSEAEELGSEAAIYQPVIHTYGLQDGLRQNIIVERTLHLDSKNRLWMGNSSTSVIMLEMNNFKTPFAPPKIQLDWIEINEQFVDYRQLKDSPGIGYDFTDVAKHHNYPLNLELPYKRNHLTFHFSAIDWSAPHKLKYSYKMVGLDKEWSKPSPEAKADFRSLPFGKYTFKVRSIGAAQKWSNTFEYNFTIHPPWWFAWWAFILYGMILVLLIRWYRSYLLARAKLRSELKVEKIEKEKVVEMDHMRSRFFANISHEFRTPLTLILGPIEDAAKKRSERIELNRDMISMMHRNARRLQQLINQLLDVSKLETGKVMLKVSEGSLDELVKTIVISFESLAASKQINFTFDLPESSGSVYFDRDKVEKVLSNLLSNAFKFTSAGGKVHVTLRYDPADGKQFAEITVSDTGIGIASDRLEKIFDRFYQVNDSDTRTEEGTGIGLALAREMVDLYRGEISAESISGKGSTFRVKLPVSVEQFAEDEIVKIFVGDEGDKELEDPGLVQEDPSDIESTAVVFPGTAKDAPIILLVEDNADLSKYIGNILGNSYRVLTAENGVEGFELASENIPDLVISDVMMPLMDGMEMCRKIKNDERTSHIPLIMLTARADRGSKLEGLETGADDYIIKPFDAEELKVRVRNMIEQRNRLREIFRKEFESDSMETSAAPFGDQVLKKLLTILNQHIADSEFKLDQLADELNMSRSQMFRKIFALTGYTPKDLIRKMRLKKAASLFRSGHHHVAQVMHQVGFNNQSYFGACFNKLYGLTPSEYIRSNSSQASHPE